MMHAGDATYDQQPEPYQRHQKHKDDWRRIQNENRIIASKLRELQREPPATFHAPVGYQSLAGASMMKAQRAGKTSNVMPCTQHHVGVSPWPPRRCETAPIRRSRHEKDVKQGNKTLTMKLIEQYTSVRPHSSHNPGGVWRHDHDVSRPDYLSMWCERAVVYGSNSFSNDVSTPSRDRPASAPARRPKFDCRFTTEHIARKESQLLSAKQQLNMLTQNGGQSGIPKTLGFAKCSGCGAHQFHKADGVNLRPCKICKQVWYCSDECEQQDRLSHRATCDWHYHGAASPGIKTGVEEHWVANAAMAKVRKELQQRGKQALLQRASLNIFTQAGLATLANVQHKSLSSCMPQMAAPGEEIHDLNKYYENERRKEKKLEQRQKRIEDKAYWGLDGPRPCMYFGGKRI